MFVEQDVRRGAVMCSECEENVATRSDWVCDECAEEHERDYFANLNMLGEGDD